MARIWKQKGDLERQGWVLLLALVCFLCVPCMSFAQAQEGPLYNIPHHKRILSFLKGGDGAYYLMLSSSGSSGRFSRNGESAFTIHRFTPDLQRTHRLKINRSSRLGLMQNAYAALPSEDGIAFIGIQRTKATGPSQLTLTKLRFEEGMPTPASEQQVLAPMVGHTPGITNPNIRLHRSADAAHLAVSWRALARPEDNSLAVIWLDDSLHTIGEGPAFPMKKFHPPARAKEIALDGYGNLIIQVQTEDPNALNPSRAGGSSGFVFHERERDSTSKVIMAPLRMIPLSMAPYTDPEIGLQWITGIYASYEADSLVIGLYRGLVSWEETMNFLETWPFSASLTDQVINRFREKDQQLSYRRLDNDLAVGGNHQEFCYLLMLSGGNEGFLKNRKGMVIQTLLSISPEGKGVTMDTLQTWPQAFHEEFRQMSGIGKIPDGGEGLEQQRPVLLFNDFSSAASSVKPYGYGMKVVQVEGGMLKVLEYPLAGREKDGFTMVAVQHKAPGDRPGEWVFPSRFRKNLRLIRLDMKTPFK